MNRGAQAAAAIPGKSVFAGMSLGVVPAQMLAQTSPDAVGALFLYSCVRSPSSEKPGQPVCRSRFTGWTPIRSSWTKAMLTPHVPWLNQPTMRSCFCIQAISITSPNHPPVLRCRGNRIDADQSPGTSNRHCLIRSTPSAIKRDVDLHRLCATIFRNRAG